MESNNELKIDLYPDQKPRYNFEKESVKKLLEKDTLAHSLDLDKNLGCLNSNVPLLSGFYLAHTNHYPIRIKPDDIWLLILQSFSNHVNINSKNLRNLFVDFEGKQTLCVKYDLSHISEVKREDLEDFIEQINQQMEKYLGKQLLETLTANFSTSNYDSILISKISIMGAFKKYFEYNMFLCGCGIPYIILEGNAEDYKKILEKTKYISKYNFSWYTDRIIPHIQKMIDAKEKKIDIDYFKDFVQNKKETELIKTISGLHQGDAKVDYICGWIVDFFAYIKYDKFNYERIISKKIQVKDFKYLLNQMLIVPITIKDIVHNETHEMKYKVGFVGCDQNDKNEVFPVQGWFISPSNKFERESII